MAQTLVQKLISVYDEIDHIDKRGTNSVQNYKYVKATDLAHAVRKALLKLNVYAEINFQALAQYTISRAADKAPFTANDVLCTIVFHDAESTEKLTASGLGTGADSSDKAIYKAQTGALKYALRNAFMVPDDADPEDDSRESVQKVDTKPSKPAPKPAVKPTEKAPDATKPVAKASTPASAATVPETPAESMPTPEQYNTFIERAQLFGNSLKVAGLPASPGSPVMKKFKTYVLKTAGVKELTEISTTQWETIFGILKNLQGQQPDGMAKIIKLVEESQ